MKYVVIIREGGMQAASKDYWLRDQENPEALLMARGKFWVRAMEYFYQHWHNRDDVYVMRYENLCADPVKQVGKLLEWLDLELAPLIPHLPTKLTNRTDKIDGLAPELRQELMGIIGPMQQQIDEDYPTVT